MARVAIHAAGVVLLDEFDRVAAVHRPRRGDWSLPKGKFDADECPIDAARRETREETGVEAVLGSRLPSVRYTVAGQLKEVDYWAARIRVDHGFVPGPETDQLEWVDLQQAGRLLTYPHDLTTVQLALSLPATSPLILLRHASAWKRADWPGPDALRPLRPEGLGESDRLVSQLIAFGVSAIHSSDAERCLATVAPLSTVTGLGVTAQPELSEAGFEHDPRAAGDRIARLLSDPTPTVVCTHRPILPSLLRRLVADAAGDPSDPALDPHIPPGGFIVLHRAFTSARARLVAAEVHIPLPGPRNDPADPTPEARSG